MIRDFGLLLAVGIVAICICSIVLPISILGIREYKSPTKGGDFREGPLGRLVVWLGSLPPKLAPAFFVVSMVIFVVGAVLEGELDAPDRSRRMGQPGHRGHRGHRHHRVRGRLVQRAGHVRRSPTTCSPTRPSSSSTSSSTTARGVPGHRARRAADGVQHRQHRQLPDGDPRRHHHPADRRGGAARRSSARAGRHPGGDRRRRRRRPQRHLPHRRRRPRGAGGRGQRRARQHRRRPRASRATPSGLAVVGVGLLENLEENRIALTYIAIAFVGIFLAIRLRSVVRSLLSLVPVLIAVGAASIVAYAFSLEAQPHDRGRRPDHRGHLHRVHLADPAALRRGAAPGARAAGGGRRGRRPHRPGVHRVGHGGRRRRGGHRPVVAPAAARLRRHRGDERGGRPAQRPGVPAAHAGVGRPGRAGSGCRGASSRSRTPQPRRSPPSRPTWTSGAGRRARRAHRPAAAQRRSAGRPRASWPARWRVSSSWSGWNLAARMSR